MVHLQHQTPKGEPAAELEAHWQMILIEEYKSDMKEVHGDRSNPLIDMKAR